MDVSNLISSEPPPRTQSSPIGGMPPPHSHQYATRQAMASNAQQGATTTVAAPTFNQAERADASPQAIVTPKLVAFELLLPESPDYRARLPMRVHIYPHDTTDSIITTVKNFYGLYQGPGGARGVSFEDQHGNTLIARYENFQHDMVVYVRVMLEPSYAGTPKTTASSPQYQRGYSDEPQHHMVRSQSAQSLTCAQLPSRSGSRPDSRTTIQGSTSSHLGHETRSQSASPNQGQLKKTGSRATRRRRGSNAQDTGQDQGSDAINGFSDSDGGHGSVAGSRKTKGELLTSADISLDNIVEGGRRKRAKFESSELPLFVPPQVPIAGSPSSMSPASRVVRPNVPSPLGPPTQRVFAYPQPLQSPLKQGAGDAVSHRPLQLGSTQSTPPATGHGHHLRNRARGNYTMTRRSAGTPTGRALGILPTPDPTVASCISEEDAALQLMRLGDVTNLSNGTRLSASTVDDGLSGVADVASSDGTDSDEHAESEAEKASPSKQSGQRNESNSAPLPVSTRKRHKHMDVDSTEPSGDEVVSTSDANRLNRTQVGIADGFRTTSVNASERLVDPEVAGANTGASRESSIKNSKVDKIRPLALNKNKAKTAPSLPKTPMSPASLPPHSRKPSTASTANVPLQNLREDEEDLSSKPRCQRCRKSKKGCDRQRPCQRCKDAGIGLEGCISEDETNGRKGRFGRHMGVVVKKGSRMPVQGVESQTPPESVEAVAGGGAGEKGKKRKR